MLLSGFSPGEIFSAKMVALPDGFGYNKKVEICRKRKEYGFKRE